MEVSVNKLEQVLAFIEAGTGWAALIPGAGTVAAAAAALVRIAAAANRAHQSITGEPIDLNKLHELPHVE